MERGKAAIVGAAVLTIIASLATVAFSLDMFVVGLILMSSIAVVMAWGFPENFDPENWEDWRA